MLKKFSSNNPKIKGGNMMKKALSILLVLLMAFSAVACTATAPAEPAAEATTAPEAAATEVAVEATEAPVKVDFSQNQNVITSYSIHYTKLYEERY